jgi:hypothetical protein
MIRFACPGCKTLLSVSDELAGRKATCPKCSEVAEVPGFSAAPRMEATPARRSQRDEDHWQDSPSRPRAGIPSEGKVVVELRSDSLSQATKPSFFRAFLTNHWRRIPTSMTLWLVLPLFFLPWIDVKCNGMKFIQQTGMQTCTGKYSLSEDLEALAKNNPGGPTQSPNQTTKDDLEGSGLSWLYFAFLIVGSLIAVAVVITVIIFQVSARAPHTGGAKVFGIVVALGHFAVLLLGSLCFLALFFQMIVGFPIDRQIKKANDEKAKAMQGTTQPPGGPDNLNPGMNNLGASLGAAIDLRTSYSPWLWLSFLICLLSPLFLVLEGILTGYSLFSRKSEPSEVFPEYETD